MSADVQGILATALSSSALSAHLDEDSSEYILSILLDDPNDADAREAVEAFVHSSIDDDAGSEVCAAFFRRLDAALVDGGSCHQTDCTSTRYGNDGDLPRRLDAAITLKSHDIQSFASGLVANVDPSSIPSDETPSDIQSFYANMIDVSDHPRAKSERERRKGRQKEMREKMEEEERRRAIDDAMRMMQDEQEGRDDRDAREEMAEIVNAADNAADVHFTNFNLPNRKGGGADLLVDASLTLAGSRRYGLMGRNGCGKTTLLTALASRQLGGVGGGIPKNMSMLLVRQEIMGNDLSAVETVLKSDVKREGVKRWIQYIESELNKLDNPNYGNDESNIAKTGDDIPASSKGKQKLKERKKNKSIASVAASKKSTDNIKSASTSSEDTNIDEKRKKLNLKLTNAYERLARIEQEEGGDPEPRARKVLFGLGFTTPEMQNKPTKELSGGWRMRVSLSCALFANPALLLLDEPTNHLDLEAVLWLEKYLTTQFKGTLVVVSHDRHFLNEVVTDVVHFHQGKLTNYRGDINSFVAVREENRKRQIRLYEQQEAKRAHLQKYIDLHAQAGENGVKAARQRKSRMKKLDKLGVMAQEGKKFKASYDGEAEEVEEYVEDEEVVLTFPDPGGFDGDIVRLELVSFGYTEENTLLRNVDLSIDMTSRVALLGRNGCGKSTLIKLVVGALQAKKGKVTINGRAKIEYLAQHQLEQLDPDGTPMSTMLERYPGDQGNAHKMELRRYLANFGLGGDVLPLQKIHTMSGGQKCRLCLAAAMYRKPHLLILDEPTNHLDLETTEALIEAIKEFQGGVLLVSHDQHLLTSVCKDLYVVEKGHVDLLRHGTTNGEAFERYKKDVILGRR
eukprot:CCRYP_002715-RC/>CCRYP_002715-RC protein AED:0.07 eAED:0.07 QI:78/1/1/1/1/1/8/355/851